ncbi:MAG: DUF1513 domain-containing protein [Alphaproteobacteria bacterium]|nr:DUF1513 domain-containing protein [Alphaproteobacteria bacterium]
MAASAVFLAAGNNVAYAKAGQPIRYCVTSPYMDDLSPTPLPMNNGLAAGESIQAIPFAQIPESDYKTQRTLLTVADEDGKRIRRVFVPGSLHNAMFSGTTILCLTRGNPGYFYALDTETLQPASVVFPESGTLFGGHMIPWMNDGQVAITVNIQREGAYDRVDVYDATTLKKIEQINSYGFQAHELALTPDKKTLYVGHYGSNYSSGPYKHLAQQNEIRLRAPDGQAKPMTFYPGSVSAISLDNKTLIDRQSSDRNGPQGHLAPSSTGQVFLTRLPPFLMRRGDEMQNPVYAEGTENKICTTEMFSQHRLRGTGTTVVVDDTHQQFILANTRESAMSYGALSTPQEMKKSAPTAFNAYKKPQGLAFHPDGIHYIASCTNGFMTFKRSTHEFVPERSFTVALGEHSHMCLG